MTQVKIYFTSLLKKLMTETPLGCTYFVGFISAGVYQKTKSNIVELFYK
jgi:hypothetical protein